MVATGGKGYSALGGKELKNMSRVYTFYENLFLSNFLNFDENSLMIRTKLICVLSYLLRNMNWVYNKSCCLFVFVGRRQLCNNLVYNNVKIKSDTL